MTGPERDAVVDYLAPHLKPLSPNSRTLAAIGGSEAARGTDYLRAFLALG